VHPAATACPGCDPPPGDGGTCDAGSLGTCPVGGKPACVVAPTTAPPYCSTTAPAECCPSTGCTSHDVECPSVACDER
jgi:hypothetical protein